MSALFTYLGWDHAKVGTKTTDFASFNALGVSVQLDNLNKESFMLRNKEGHTERLCGMFLVSSFARLADIARALGSDDLCKLCTLAVNLLKAMPPRKYLVEFLKNPFLIFTDGAWESDCATGGALAYDPLSEKARVFEVEIPSELTSFWLEEVGEQLISQIEFFVHLAFRFHCQEALLNRLGIAWIDNEAARFVAIKVV
eukprot:s1072_g4.t1